jgi:hypothetical protein
MTRKKTHVSIKTMFNLYVRDISCYFFVSNLEFEVASSFLRHKKGTEIPKENVKIRI